MPCPIGLRRTIRRLTLSLLALPAIAGAQLTAVPANEWEVPWGAEGRPRDPYVAPDGSVFFVGQNGNYIAKLDPRSGQFTKYEIDPGTNPHNLIVDPQGMVWYAGNRNGMIGRMNPTTREITRYPMPDARVRDPHTLIFDARGDIWFTAQNSGAVGHLETRTGRIRLAFTAAGSRPYGIVLNSKGTPWFNLFGTDQLATIDPATMAVRTFTLPNERARGRRIAVTSDDIIWYGDYTRGILGRLDPVTGRIDEIPLPAGPGSLPYGMATDDKDRIWVAQNVPNQGTTLVGYDPKTRRFFGEAKVGRAANNTIRHMYFDRRTGMLWFGTDQGAIGRAEVSRARVAM